MRQDVNTAVRLCLVASLLSTDIHEQNIKLKKNYEYIGPFQLLLQCLFLDCLLLVILPISSFRISWSESEHLR